MSNFIDDTMAGISPGIARGIASVFEGTEKAAAERLLDGLNDKQRAAVSSKVRRLFVVAGAGAGKTEVMARRIAWLVAEHDVPKNEIVAFTFTERAAEEMKFRIRRHVAASAKRDEEATLGDMYVGTIHAFCLNKLRELAPDDFHNYDVLDDVGRLALVQRTYGTHLGLAAFQTELRQLSTFGVGQFGTMDKFFRAYDILNEYGELRVRLPGEAIPSDVTADRDWCKAAVLETNIGTSDMAMAFGTSAARYYALLRSRRFLDFSTAQNELLRLLESSDAALEALRSTSRVVVVDEVQDLNPVQRRIMDLMVGDEGQLVAVGDHRQAIFGFRGGLVRIMGEMYDEVAADTDSALVDLSLNYRSTPRIIALANAWAGTIAPPGGLPNIDMRHGNEDRADYDPSHVGITRFPTVQDEAEWVASKIAALVVDGRGARHDARRDDVLDDRGLGYQDVAILLRASTNARAFMRALEQRGIPAIFRAGPDLFAQPEVLLFLAALSVAAGVDDFQGRAIQDQIAQSLAVQPVATDVVQGAAASLLGEGLAIAPDAADRLLRAAALVRRHINKDDTGPTNEDVATLTCEPLKRWLLKRNKPRRIFPQDVLHWFFAEVGVPALDDGSRRGEAAMFHFGALSGIVTGIESSGWTSPSDFKYQMIAMTQWGAKNARTEEAPLLVQPSAVTIATVHAVKGLEFSAVFLADVRAQSFPSSRAKTVDPYPFDGDTARRIDAANHADNTNYDAERRLMYVALTRAERYLTISASGTKRSRFYSDLEALVPLVGGIADVPERLLENIELVETRERSGLRLVTSFSDLRYFLECPHDFYLRKVLGFAPTIDQAFGYGRGVHNMLRAVHADPAHWAKLSGDPERLVAEVRGLIERGLFYLRYTTADPLKNLQESAARVVSDYVGVYREELAHLLFEPERPFETLLEEADALVTGAIDLVRLDNPPRVSLIDFKSGGASSENASKLDEEEMRLQIALYGVAAKKEMEYEPDLGFVRYIGETDPTKRELSIPLGPESLLEARETAVATIGKIRERKFRGGPKKPATNGRPRCSECDFTAICGMPNARPFATTGTSRDTPIE